MTRDEIVSFVGTDTGYTAPDDVAAAQVFISARDRLIYDSGLWKSSLVLCKVPLSPSTNLDHAAGVVFLPAVVGRAVGIRIDAAGSAGNLGGSLRVRALEEYFRFDFDRFSQMGTPCEFALLHPGWMNVRAAAGGSVTLSWADPISDGALTVKAVYRDSGGNRFTQSGVLPMTFRPFADGFTGIEAVFKPAGGSGLNVNITGGAMAGSMGTETRSPAYVQVRLFSAPNVDLTLNVLGKGVYDAMTHASQEPTVFNSENLLIELLRANLLRRGGEYGESEKAFTLASTLLSQLKDVEMVQEATNQQIIPEGGYGPDWRGQVGSWLRPGR